MFTAVCLRNQISIMLWGTFVCDTWQNVCLATNTHTSEEIEDDLWDRAARYYYVYREVGGAIGETHRLGTVLHVWLERACLGGGYEI